MVEGQMMQVLAEMSVISEQKAVSYDGVSVHGGEKNRVPHLSEIPMVDVYRQAFNEARSDAARQRVLEEAREALVLARRSPLPAGQEPEFGTPQWKRWVAEVCTDSHAEVARKFNVSRQYVHQIRSSGFCPNVK